jgi:hypothetical protein
MTANGDESRTSAVEFLHSVYEKGALRILVGAGTSLDAGFRDWGTMNEELLKFQVETDIGIFAQMLGDKIPTIARNVYQAIGRDAAAALVWDRAGRAFFREFAEILYRGREISDLPVLSIHYQIAAMTKAGVFTTNYDPLLELGFAKLLDDSGPQSGLHGDTWQRYRRVFRGTNITKSVNERVCVYHVHGWVDPGGRAGGPFVLTEGQYFRLFEDPGSVVNRTLHTILTARGAVLMVGMSLSDTNLRRILYQQASYRSPGRTRIFALLRRGDELVDAYEMLHWNRYGVQVLWVQDYSDIPSLLREVCHGAAKKNGPPPWATYALQWLQTKIPPTIIFGDAWQQAAYAALRELLTQVRLLFAVAPEEVLKVSFFVPLSKTDLGIVADSREPRSGESARKRAKSFRLAIDPHKPQGISGVAYVSGKEVEVLDDPQAADRNFSSDMLRIWYSHGYRDWRSALAVPLMDSQHWVPVGVMTITSNKGEPFWTRFGQAKGRYQPELYTTIRKTAKILLTCRAEINLRTRNETRRAPN